MTAIEPRVLLIGGSSNAGKSTVAALLGARPGWMHVSTDSLGRHPGRPWPTPQRAVPEHVAKHYLTLGPDQLLRSVLVHYRNMAPSICTLIERHARDPAQPKLVLEGSGLLPETVVGLDVVGAAAVFLTANDDLFRARIVRESGYDTLDPRGQKMVEKFVARTRRYNAYMMEGVREHGLPFVMVDGAKSAEALAQDCLRLAR